MGWESWRSSSIKLGVTSPAPPRQHPPSFSQALISLGKEAPSAAAWVHLLRDLGGAVAGPGEPWGGADWWPRLTGQDGC